MLILFDSGSGALKAIIEAFAMGQLRTGSVSGLATRWMSRQDASEFALIGTGKQALHQAAAVLAVRPIRRIRVYSPNRKHRSEFAEVLKRHFEVEAVAAGSCSEATDGAGVITTFTRATEAFLTSDMVGQGAHVNSIGAIVPSRAELAFNVPAWSVYEYGNEGSQWQVRLTYSNAPLLEKLKVHVVEENPDEVAAARAGAPEAHQADPKKANPFGTFKLTEHRKVEAG